VIVVCVAVVGEIVASSSGSDDGPRTFMVGDSNSALLLEWTRVGDGVSGSMTRAQLVVSEASRFASDPVAAGVPRELTRDSRPFTGTISGDSVRLLFTDGNLPPQINGRRDGDALTLTLTGSDGPPTPALDERLTRRLRQGGAADRCRGEAAGREGAGEARRERCGGPRRDQACRDRLPQGA